MGSTGAWSGVLDQWDHYTNGCDLQFDPALPRLVEHAMRPANRRDLVEQSELPTAWVQL